MKTKVYILYTSGPRELGEIISTSKDQAVKDFWIQFPGLPSCAMWAEIKRPEGKIRTKTLIEEIDSLPQSVARANLTRMHRTLEMLVAAVHQGHGSQAENADALATFASAFATSLKGEIEP